MYSPDRTSFHLTRAILLGSFLLALAVMVPSMLFPALVELSQSGTQNPPAEPVVATPAPTPAEPFDWAPVIYIGAAAVAMLLVIAVVVLARGPWNRASAAREERHRERIAHEMAEHEMKTLWNQSTKRLRLVEEQYTTVMCDPATVLAAPLIDDVTHPPTAAFYDAWEAAREADQPVQPASRDEVRKFYSTTRTLLEAWDTALVDARRLGASTLSTSDRRDLDLATRLLATALDQAATVPERRGALDRARTLIDRLGLMRARPGLPRTGMLDDVTEAIATAERTAITD